MIVGKVINLLGISFLLLEPVVHHHNLIGHGKSFPLVMGHARAQGIQHLRTSQRAGAPERLATLQEHGFAVRWASVQIACDTRLLRPSDALPEHLTFTTDAAEHLPELLAIARDLPPYNWPEFEPGLPAGARARYVEQRLENCVLTPYADHCLVALWRGRPAGFHASALSAHGGLETIGHPFAYVRETFVAPNAPPFLGHHLLRRALCELRDVARHVTGRVRLDGLAMLNTALGAGYRIAADELLLATQPDT